MRRDRSPDNVVRITNVLFRLADSERIGRVPYANEFVRRVEARVEAGGDRAATAPMTAFMTNG